MAFVVIAETPGLTQEQYDTTLRHVLQPQPSPAGLLVRLDEPMEGGWRVLDVWASKPDADAFVQSEAVKQMLQNLGDREQTFTTWHVNDITT